MKKIWLVLLILGCAISLQAEGNGGFAGSFLRIGLGARGMAMGNAQVASAGHGFGFYYNPAGLPFLEKRSANFSYSFMSLDRRFYFVGLSTPLRPRGGFAIGWIYSGVGNIQGYDSRGVETGEINHGLHAIYFSFGVGIIPGRLTAGISAKYLIENISDEGDNYSYKGTGVGADLGLMFQATSFLTIGYQLKDLNGRLRSNTGSIFERGMTLDNDFPLSNKLGFYLITPWKWARLAYDFEWSDAGEEKNHLGLEFVIPAASLRLGYDNNHFTFGGGLNISSHFGVKTILNYAFINSVVDEGVSHIFSWQFAF